MYLLQVFVIVALAADLSHLTGSKPDINDPETNLDYFVRTAGSKDPKESSVNYMNGSIFAKQPGKGLQKILNFEGYNINRKLLQADGSYLSLSREFVVYRDLRTHAILNVWMNPWSLKPNEVFFVSNDPVNFHLRLGNIIPTAIIPGRRVVFNVNILLRYPNPLDPTVYQQYSAGPVYEAAELFGYFTSLARLRHCKEMNVPETTTWIRRSQYLPWMEMSTAEGELYYTAFSWKCKNEGLACVADDIMELINDNYPEFKEAPTVEEVPNETSWTVFKAVIDKRRDAGLPDIIIPPSIEIPNATTYNTFVDKRITNFFKHVRKIKVYFNGTAWSQMIRKQPVNLFNVDGGGFLKVTESRGGFYTVSLTGCLSYRSAQTGTLLKTWSNPFTGAINTVPNPVTFINKIFDFPKEFVYSMDIPQSRVIGLLAAESEETGLNVDDWSVNIAEMIFDRASFRRHSKVFFYGTAGRFSNWLEWMNMRNVQGNMVFKITFYRK